MRNRFERTAVVAATVVLMWSCGSPPAPPAPGEARGAVPDLRGYSVMVLPVQLKTSVPSGALADPELAHALRSRGDGVTWTFPPQLEESLQRSPGVSVRLNGLPVQVFNQAEVNRIGDPLFGHLVRLATLSGADVALLPVSLEYAETGTFILSTALINTGNGRVVWYGVLEGEPGGQGDPAALASVTEALAKTLFPFG